MTLKQIQKRIKHKDPLIFKIGDLVLSCDDNDVGIIMNTKKYRAPHDKLCEVFFTNKNFFAVRYYTKHQLYKIE